MRAALRALAGLLALAAAAAPAAAAERVLNFYSDIRIAANGELTVSELIQVEAEGRVIRHGIYRDFPTDYRDRYGAKVHVPFSVTRVTLDGQPEPYALERLANGVRVRIGRADRLVPPGRHLYGIVYRTARQVGFFGDHDELYWNVNGNGWTLPFERIGAVVALPQPVDAGRIGVEAYTGPQGARGHDYRAAARDGRAVFETTRELPAHQGLTIVVSFPKGIVTPPGAAQRAKWWLEDNRGALAGALGFVLLLAFLGWRWWLVGRDPRAGPKYPRYEPPPGLGPGGVRYVDRMGADDRAFAAALLGLGARGYLRIERQGETFAIDLVGKEVGWLPGEQELARGLFKSGPRFVLPRRYDAQVAALRTEFRQALDAHFGGRLFSRNRGSHAAGVAIAALACLSALWLEAPPVGVFALAAACAVTLALFARWLPAYSVEGRRLEDAIAGLRLYLGVAEKDELARMKAPPQTGEEFARLLPYAMALEVEKTWADRFAATLGAAAVSAAVAHYYVSDRLEPSPGAGFAGAFSDLGHAVSAAATPPGSSSGGGGGGSSGGGGGGGGGGGW